MSTTHKEKKNNVSNIKNVLGNIVNKKKNVQTKKAVKDIKKNIKKEDTESFDENDSSMISEPDENASVIDAFDYDKKKENSQKNSSQSTKKSHKSELDDEKDNIENLENIDEDAHDEYVQTVVIDRIVKYIKLDDIIKQKQEEHKKELKFIKDTKAQLEQFLIDYLDKKDEEYIKLGTSSTLVKTETKTKAAPKMEDISTCLVDGFRKYEIYDNDDEIKRVVKDFITSIDAKREVKTRKYLKRIAGENDKKDKDTNDKDSKDKLSAKSIKNNKQQF
jgi:hypothetical protein